MNQRMEKKMEAVMLLAMFIGATIQILFSTLLTASNKDGKS